jgi:AraC-like DNA-binding protein
MELATTPEPVADRAASTIVSRLQRSALFLDYQKAFEITTGLPLVLRKPGAFEPPLHSSKRVNPFCALMAGTSKSCATCLQFQATLEEQAAQQVTTAKCQAGLNESAVPIRVGATVIGYLETGQIHFARPTPRQADEIIERICADNARLDPAMLRETYLQTRVIGEKTYASMLRLVAIFAQHLGSISNQLLIAADCREMPVIKKVRTFIQLHQGEDLSLGEVARAVNMSPFYFCKMFKRAMGMTFTTYLGRLRVESVKGDLLDEHKNVSEAAYAAGFQSLSQFNRVFRRFAGESPSTYRQRANHEAPSLELSAR